MKDKNKLIVLISGVLVILLMVFGISFAIFRFGEESTNQELVLGDIWMKYTESNGISLENALPGDEYTNYFEFTITGTNTYTKKDIFYDISLVHGDIPAGKSEENRISDKYLKFKLTEVNGNTETEIFTDKTYDDLTNKRVHVDTISKSTNTYSKTYRLYMVISEELTYGNSSDAILSTEEFGKIFGSVKVNVTGDFNEKVLSNATDESCFVTYRPIVSYQMLDVAACGAYLSSINFCHYDSWGNAACETEAVEFCQGIGEFYDGYTFEEFLLNDKFEDDTLNYMINNNIISVTRAEYANIVDYDDNCSKDVIIPETINGVAVNGIYQRSNTKIHADDELLLSSYNDAFNGSSLTSVSIPNSVTEIGSRAFYDNNLTEIILPNSIAKIGTYAFANNRLESVLVGTNVIEIGAGAFLKNNANYNPLTNGIINKTNRSFDWNVIIKDGISSDSFVSGTVTTEYGNVVIAES